MQSSYWGYWLIVFGVALIGLMISVQGLTTTSTKDYYSIKEINQISLQESIDWAYYRDYNELKINKEKFFEVFIRSLSDNITGADDYTVNFYGVYEAPPKASVEVITTAGGYEVTTRSDALIQIHATQVYSNNGYTSGSNSGYTGSVSSAPGSPNSTSSSGNINSNYDWEINNGGNICTSTGGNQGGNTTPPPANLTVLCGRPVSSFDVSQMTNPYAYFMGPTPIYDSTLTRRVSTMGSTNQSVRAKVLGNYINSNDKSEWWAIESNNGSCYWVNSAYLSVNLDDYLPSNVQFNIYNKTSSQYRSSGLSLSYGGKSITGVKLYTDAYVPLGGYGFAKKLKDAANKTSRTLIVNDAYRPNQVSQRMSDVFIPLVEQVWAKSSNPTEINAYNNVERYAVVNGINTRIFGAGSFVARTANGGSSAHNFACAVDITFANSTMPSAMHELSIAAAVGKQGTTTPEANYVFDTNDAKELHDLMTGSGVGLVPLFSEWWHFQDDTCRTNMKVISSTGSNFWSNV